MEKTTRFSLTLAVLVFIGNMIAAWWITGHSNEVIGRPLIQDKNTAVSLAISNAPGASANSHVLLNRVLDTELMLRAAQNRHTITVVALSVAFALVAIGFALFVMGAEGAFKLEGKMQSSGNLMVKATAPGLLCFVLATIVVISALLSKTELKPGDFSIYPDKAALGVLNASTGGSLGEGYVAPTGEEIPDFPELEEEEMEEEVVEEVAGETVEEEAGDEASGEDETVEYIEEESVEIEETVEAVE